MHACAQSRPHLILNSPAQPISHYQSKKDPCTIMSTLRISPGSQHFIHALVRHLQNQKSDENSPQRCRNKQERCKHASNTGRQAKRAAHASKQPASVLPNSVSHEREWDEIIMHMVSLPPPPSRPNKNASLEINTVGRKDPSLPACSSWSIAGWASHAQHRPRRLHHPRA